MKRKLGIKENRPLADFLPTITITAKQLATEITNFNVKKNKLKGEGNITSEHVKNNKDVSAGYFGLTMPVISVKPCHFERSSNVS